jgi:hypothetical protein
MKALGSYDGTLQMFVEGPRDADTHRLRFLRWLVEHRKLEHGVAGPPHGSYAAAIDAHPDDTWPTAA